MHCFTRCHIESIRIGCSVLFHCIVYITDFRKMYFSISSLTKGSLSPTYFLVLLQWWIDLYLHIMHFLLMLCTVSLFFASILIVKSSISTITWFHYFMAIFCFFYLKPWLLIHACWWVNLDLLWLCDKKFALTISK